MEEFYWQATDDEGNTYVGRYSAESAEETANFVRTHYGYVTKLQKASLLRKMVGLDKRFAARERGIFFGQLGVMLKSGLSFLKALEILRERMPTKTAEICLGLLNCLKNGDSFAQALRKQSDTFAKIDIAIVETGETGGFLPDMLEELSQYYKQQDKIQRFLKNISLYPLFLLMVSTCTACLFIVKILPLFIVFYSSLGVPQTTEMRLLLGLHFCLTGYAPVCALALSVTIVLCWRLRREIIRLIFKIPILARKRKLYLEIRYVKILALLLRCGMALPLAAELAGSTLGEKRLQKSNRIFIKNLLAGMAPLSAALKVKPFFGDVTIQFIDVGTESGNLPEMLWQAAELLQREFDDDLKNLKVVLEPCLLLLASLVVGFIVLTIAAPMFSLAASMPNF